MGQDRATAATFPDMLADATACTTILSQHLNALARHARLDPADYTDSASMVQAIAMGIDNLEREAEEAKREMAEAARDLQAKAREIDALQEAHSKTSEALAARAEASEEAYGHALESMRELAREAGAADTDSGDIDELAGTIKGAIADKRNAGFGKDPYLEAIVRTLARKCDVDDSSTVDEMVDGICDALDTRLIPKGMRIRKITKAS